VNTGVKLKLFSEMNLKPELVEALRRMNFIKATDVQEQVIPIAIQGKDVIVRAKTGTGKTCAFLIPILQSTPVGRDPEALIIVPTRELALQITEVAHKLTRRENVVVVYGGASINVQVDALRRNPRIIIGTPGRILDLMERGNLRIENIRFLVLDEADTMLDMGFIEDIEKIIGQTPYAKQTLLFSATMPGRIVNVAKRHMHDVEQLSIGAEEEIIVTKIKHFYALSDNRMKFATLLAYIKAYQPKKAIIFVSTQFAASAIHEALQKQGMHAILLHGGLTQARREHSMREFKRAGSLLIATNIASRGIDIQGISDVINFDAPEDPHVYVHRVGRSARMNADGRAFTIIGNQERNLVGDIEHATNVKMERLGLNAAEFGHIIAFKRRNFGRDDNRFGKHYGHRQPYEGGRHGGGGGGHGGGGYHHDRQGGGHGGGGYGSHQNYSDRQSRSDSGIRRRRH
jgi:ATP-dependent RNA helicase DeaD